MTRIAIIIGSTRPGRHADAVAQWAADIATQRTDAEFEIVDLLDIGLPLLDESFPPSLGRYQNQHTRDWAATVARYDGYILVTPEYNHSTSAVLKNALDFVYAEWNNKSVGFISYGSSGGTRAVEHLRLIVAELQMADVRAQVSLPLATDFINLSEFRPQPQREAQLGILLDQLISWSTALEAVRGSAAGT